MSKKKLIYKNIESLQPIVNVVNEAGNAINDKTRTISESAIPEVLTGALGAGIGGAISFTALYGLGTVGLSAVGITSGLATAGEIIGGGMVAGHVQDDGNSPLFTFLYQALEVCHGAVVGVNIVVVVHIIAVVGLGGVNRQQPDTGNAQVACSAVITVIQIIQLCRDPVKVADTVSVRVGKGADKNAVIHALLGAFRSANLRSKLPYRVPAFCLPGLISAGTGGNQQGAQGSSRGRQRSLPHTKRQTHSLPPVPARDISSDFCPFTKSTTKGTATSRAPAANIVKLSFERPLINSKRPTARVFFSSLRRIKRGKM